MWIAIFTVWISVQPADVKTFLPNEIFASEKICYDEAKAILARSTTIGQHATIKCIELKKPEQRKK